MAIVRYPSEFSINNPNMDYMVIQAIRKEYQQTKGSPNSGSGPASDFVPAADSRFTNTVVLNMPQKVGEAISQQWRNASLGTEAYNILSGKLGRGAGATVTSMGFSVIRKLVESSILNTSIDALGRLGSSSLSENSVLSATSGIVYNPMMEVLYDGPDFRTFNFQFMLLAKSKEDAKRIYKIVRFFQWASVPSSSGGIVNTELLESVIAANSVVGAADAVVSSVSSAFNDPTKAAGALTGGVASILGSLGSGVLAKIATGSGALFGADERFIKQPPLIQITYMRGANQHPFIMPLKPAAITGLQIDYTPTGNYTILDNVGEDNIATTVATTITLNITENKNMFAEDYVGDKVSGRYTGA
jgi:hypothetical protein